MLLDSDVVRARLLVPLFSRMVFILEDEWREFLNNPSASQSLMRGVMVALFFWNPHCMAKRME